MSEHKTKPEGPAPGQPANYCCDNGNFGEPHDCQKQNPATAAPSQPAAREWKLVHRTAEVLAAFPRVGTMALESSDGYAVPFDDAELVELAKGHLQIVSLEQSAAKDADAEAFRLQLRDALKLHPNVAWFGTGLLTAASAAVQRAEAAERERDSLRKASWESREKFKQIHAYLNTATPDIEQARALCKSGRKMLDATLKAERESQNDSH